MNRIIMALIALSAVLGGLDKILGNRFGLGKWFDEGFSLIGPMLAGMTGILCLTPVLAGILQASAAPLMLKLGLDPSILAGILPIDMGGYQLALGMAADPRIGKFSAVILTSTFGCTLVFSIPVGFGMMKESNRRSFMLGIMYGLIFLPVPVLIGGLLSGLGFMQTICQSLPVLIPAFLLAVGIRTIPEKLIRIFMIFAPVIRALSVIGILAALTEYLTGITLIPGLMDLREALQNAALCGILLIGCMPFAEILNRILHRPLHNLGTRIGIRDQGITGMLLTLVSVIAALGLMHEMEEKDVTLNAAFLVSAAAVFGPHLSVCAANAPELAGAMVGAKLLGGFCAAAFTVFLLRRKESPASL